MIYLDNAATSCPKPREVVQAVEQALSDVCANPSRGAYELSLEASRVLLRSRRAVAALFGIGDESRVVFTLNATHALNLALKGLLGACEPRRSGGLEGLDHTGPDGGEWGRVHVVTSSVEHNAMARPLATLERRGVEVTRVRCASDGSTDPDDILAAVRPDTRLVALTHASNVLGTILPIAEVGPALKERGVPLLVDSAQTAGCLPIDVEAMGISLLAISGHKGLLGPQGVGALYIAPGLELDTLVEGGTGSQSESPEQPLETPDRFEAGTPNTPGIAGLGAGIEVLSREGVSAIGTRQSAMTRHLKERLSQVEGLKLFGPGADTATAPIVSLAVDGIASADVARILDREFHIAVRAGLHCAPEAHKVAGTLEAGLVRLSVGHATTWAEIDASIEALTDIASKPKEHWLKTWEKMNVR